MSAPAYDAPTLDDEDLPPVVVAVAPRRTNRARIIVVSLVFVLAIGFVISRGLSNATVYFRTADEAVADQHALGTRRFRVEGVVKVGTVQEQGGRLVFQIYGDHQIVSVVHTGGQPTGLFRETIPVVLEGHWSKDGAVYQSDRIIVKHDESYKAKNPDRVKEYRGVGS